MAAKLTPEQQRKQSMYRDARFTDQYDTIWQTVGKCVFCDLNEKYVFFEENGVVMTISLYAYIDGHFMIVPRRHIRSTKDISESEWATIRKFTYIAKKLIKAVHGVKGVQFVQKDGAAAQSTVTDHVHFHCVPFDAPDLLTWNYRKLKYTPLENVALYKQAGKKLLSADSKFEAKYANQQRVGIVCDLVLVNNKQQILFQERTPGAALAEDSITLPGGSVDTLAASLEQELAREVQEEIGLTIAITDLQLINSQLDAVTYKATSQPLNASYNLQRRFVRNTYLLHYRDQPLTAGDDAQALIWIDAQDIASHPRISPETKAIIKAAQL